MITGPMLEACLKGLKEKSVEDVYVLKVPGAGEIPIAIQRSFRRESYDSVIALGAIIKGETDHYTAICDLVTRGLSHLSLDLNTPIFFEVLMVDSYQKAEERISKGYEVVETMLETLEALDKGAQRI